MKLTMLGTAAIGYPFAFCNCEKGKCIDECKSIDYNYWNKYHEIPQFMSFVAIKKGSDKNE